jgi:predicted DNA-binding antitoxin AbrB/MazE fold protein
MSITFEATYENGVLRPLTPVPFKENEKVTVIVDDEVRKRLERVRATAGMINFAGDPKDLERTAMDPEFSIYEAP